MSRVGETLILRKSGLREGVEARMGFWVVFGGPRAGFWEGKSLEKASRKSLKFRWIFGRGFSRILAPNWEPKPSPGGSFLAFFFDVIFCGFFFDAGGKRS